MLLSGSTAKLNNEVFLKSIDEVLSRLPLNLLLANDRVHNNANTNPQVNLVYEYCADSCELLLHSLIDNFISIRKLSGFQSSWVRFVSILATNANILVRGSHVHNKMLDMIASLLQILKVSKPLTIHDTSNQNNTTEQVTSMNNDATESASSDDSVVVVTTPPTSTAGGGAGWLSWWGNSEPTPVQIKNDDATKKSQTDEADTVGAIQAVNAKPLSPSTTSSQRQEVDEQAYADDNDNELLFVTWNTACSSYQLLPIHLRIKYPQLVTQILKCVEKYEKINNVQAVKDHVLSSNPLVQVV